MHCFQCQEAKDNVACTVAGMCGKKATTANLEDLLIYTLKGIAVRAEANGLTSAQSRFVNQAIFTTITNANFDDTDLADFIVNALELRDSLPNNSTLDCATWTSPVSGFGDKASTVGILQTNPNEDVIA
ncbi:MAG: hydroxylamine reductase, partial [Lentisphaeria bacterium]|nr:hydroxylamine reductase [Lentisphaeria bacterium]